MASKLIVYMYVRYSCLENPHGQSSLVGYSLWGRKEWDTTERQSTAQHVSMYMGFPGGSAVKNAPVMQETQEMQFDPWDWKISWRRAWQPTPVFLPGEFHERSLAGYSPWGHKELDTTKVTEHTHTSMYNFSFHYLRKEYTFFCFSHVIKFWVLHQERSSSGADLCLIIP